MPPRKRRKLYKNISCNTELASTDDFLPMKEESTEYNMNYSHRGYALIFHHFTFNPNLKHLRPREGSEFDLERLQDVLKSLDFEVEVYEDQTAAEIKQIIHMARNTDHSDCDCLIVVVLTHGKANSVVYAKDTAYCLQELWNPFMAKECPTLVGKPKIFFIQACRGKKVDSGLQVTDKMDVHGQQILECDAYTKPSGPDFLIVYSSVEGNNNQYKDKIIMAQY
ncbi:hypothetical protein C0J52_12658 [Blattella germanica]|nr:hypothetical protein C0J52_12658 [Blattella germanica]